MQNFMNEKSALVNEALDGLVASSAGALQRLDPAGHARVIVRGGWDKSRVAIVSGGGSGHEPAHAGFVGEGLLTAAVCGDVFASPSVDAVLSAILAVTGAPGCLLIVKNYTGDRLNFGLAAEKARGLGLNVEVIMVADDVAIPGAPRPRGVAGTIFIQKIAGAMAEEGAPLADIVETVNAANAGIFTIGAARDTCTVPGNERHARVGEGMVEIGLGIHGEPGFETAAYPDARALIGDIAGRLEKAAGPEGRFCALINNLGGLSGLEMSVIANEFLATPLAGRIDLVCGPAAAVTALDMPGFSLSLIRLDDRWTGHLRKPSGPAAFPAVLPLVRPEFLPAPALPDIAAFTPSANEGVRAIVETVAGACIANEDEINALDAKVGDGDTGSTFAGAARAVMARIHQLPFAEGGPLLAALSDIKSKTMGGSSGVLFAILFARAADAFRHRPEWPSALLSGLDAMQHHGGAKLGDRTMVDALRPALETLVAGGTLGEAAEAARKGADATATMTSAKAGRSSYLEARSLDGIPDPGAEAVARLFETAASRR